MFVANSAFHQIIEIPVDPNTHMPSGPASIFITGINSPDGIMVDRDDNIWICANQKDEIVVVDKTGKVIAKLGDFGGIDPQGIARGLLTPGKFGLQSRRQVALRLELHPFPAVPQAVPPRESSVACNRLGWTLQVQGYTVSVLPARIPPFPGD